MVCGLLLLQYAHRRKLFILLWAAGWLLIAPAMLVVSGAYANAIVARVAIGVSQFLGICTAALFFWSADVFRQTGVVRSDRLKAFMALGGWLLPALGALIAFFPFFFLMRFMEQRALRDQG